MLPTFADMLEVDTLARRPTLKEKVNRMPYSCEFNTHPFVFSLKFRINMHSDVWNQFAFDAMWWPILYKMWSSTGISMDRNPPTLPPRPTVYLNLPNLNLFPVGFYLRF